MVEGCEWVGVGGRRGGGCSWAGVGGVRGHRVSPYVGGLRPFGAGRVSSYLLLFSVYRIFTMNYKNKGACYEENVIGG